MGSKRGNPADGEIDAIIDSVFAMPRSDVVSFLRKRKVRATFTRKQRLRLLARTWRSQVRVIMHVYRRGFTHTVIGPPKPNFSQRFDKERLIEQLQIVAAQHAMEEKIKLKHLS